MDITGIASLAASYSAATTSNDVSTKVLAMGLDDMREMGDGMRKMLEMSVAPHIGGNIDISV